MMDLRDLLFLVMGFWCGPAMTEICPPDWHRYGESCYVVLNQTIDWYAANRTCVASQANLAVPNSKLENNFILELFLQTFDQKPQAGLWIGCNDIDKEGNWENCPLNNVNDVYQNWGQEQPKNNGSDISYCAAYSFDSTGKWGAQSCANPRFVTCERPVNAAPPVFCLQTGDNGRLITQCLFRHIMKELPGMGVISCGKACRSESRCRSFNLLQQDGGKMVCQLNNATRHEAAEGDMKEKENCYFYDL